jgi:hypothetical protein
MAAKPRFHVQSASDSTGIGFLSPFEPLFKNLGEKLTFQKVGLFQIYVNEN